MRRPPLTTRRTVVALGAALGVLPALGGCADDGGGDTARFCELVQDNLTALKANPATPDEIDSLIDLWSDVGQRAPLAIEQDWSALTLNLETAWTATDQEEALARAYATERSAVAVAAWLSDNCAIDFGPVSTVVEQVTTTVAASTSVPGATATTP